MSESRQQSLYHDPEIYDILHAPGSASDIRGLLALERRWIPPHAQGGLWLEPACGTGRLVLLAAQRRRPCIGFDIAQPMIRYAKARATELNLDAPPRLARFAIADMTTFASNSALKRLGLRDRSVSLAFNPINTIRHLPTDRAMLDHFAHIARVLRPGGIYAVGLSVCDPASESASEDTWQGKRGSTRVTQVVQYEPPGWRRANATKCPPRKERVTSHLTITAPSKPDPLPDIHLDDAYWLRTYTRAQWQQLIDRSALRLLASTDERGRPHDPGPIGYALWLLTPHV